MYERQIHKHRTIKGRPRDDKLYRIVYESDNVHDNDMR